MEPQIQYAQTSDGLSIAFSTLGEGKPFVCMPWIPWAHQQLDWQVDEWRRWYERRAENRKLVRYDGRGTGLSESEVTDLSVEAQLLDLQAVVERLNLQQFALYAPGESGPTAIAYAARHPQHVSHLILWCAWARASDVWTSARYQAFSALMETGDWDLFAETLANMVAEWPTREQARREAALLRESVTPETAIAFFEATRGFDVTALLPQVESPTLVLHPIKASWIRVDVARSLASRIPNARLALLESNAVPVGDEVEAVARAIDEFLNEGEEGAAAPTALAKDDVRTVLFTDVEGSTALTQRLGDARAREVLREHEGMVREALKAHGGSELKTMGDGFMASFSSATRALESAIAMQRAFAAHNESAQEPILVRVGMNAGEPIAEDEDLFGTAVIRAARIAGEAKGGEILVANVVRELAEGKEFSFSDRGEVALKGFDEPVRLYEVRWGD